MHPQMATNLHHPFLGVRLNTCAHRHSIISKVKYAAYLEGLRLSYSFVTDKDAYVEGMGGRWTSHRTALIHIPLRNLNLVIDVDSLVIPDDIPSLLCMKDIVNNGLDISIEHHAVGFKDLTHLLKMATYFLIHDWPPADMPYSLHTESELRRIQCSRRTSLPAPLR